MEICCSLLFVYGTVLYFALTMYSDDTLHYHVVLAKLIMIMEWFFCALAALLGAISLIVARYRITLFLALSFFIYIGYKVQHGPTSSRLEVIPPFLISIGMIIMYQASSGSWSTVSEDGKNNIHWLLYWLGESILIFMFTYNSLFEKPSNPVYVGAVLVFGIFAALWFRGKVWNYLIVIGLELLLAVFIAISFPVFEMLLEAILNDKLKKIGDKIRAQHKCMERYYQSRNRDGGRTE